MGRNITFSGHSVSASDAQRATLGIVGDSVAILAGIDNHNRPPDSFPPLQPRGVKHCNIRATMGLPGFGILAVFAALGRTQYHVY